MDKKRTFTLVKKKHPAGTKLPDMKIRVRAPDGRVLKTFVKPTRSLYAILDDFARKQLPGGDMNKFYFEFDRIPILPVDTPESIGMTDGDVIFTFCRRPRPSDNA